MAARSLSSPCSTSRDHRSTVIAGVVDQQAEGDDQGAQRDALKVDAEAENAIVTNTAASTSRIERATTAPARNPGLNKADIKDNGDGLPKRLHEVGYRDIKRRRLVGEETPWLDPNRRVAP